MGTRPSLSDLDDMVEHLSDLAEAMSHLGSYYQAHQLRVIRDFVKDLKEKPKTEP